MLLTSLLACALSFGSAAVAPDSIARDLLPRPYEIQMNEGECPMFLPLMKLHIDLDPGKESEWAAAAAAEALEEIGIRLPEGSIVRRRHSLDNDSGGPFVLRYCRGGDLPRVPGIHGEDPPQGYRLMVSQDGIRLVAPRRPGFLNGIQTLAQLLNRMLVRGESRIPCMTIYDWPALRMRGFSEDYGRNQLPTVEDHKRGIRLLSRFKMNTHLWFIEPDHFVYTFDPTIGQDYDRFTFDEIRELVAFAKQYQIEVIPTVELLGHMEMLLSNPKYRPLAEVEGGGDLCATSDESFDLVRKIVGEVAPAFESKYLHCGLDESFQIGKGRSAEVVKQKGLERVMADYYTRMDDLVKSHGKTMMMYADIVLAHPQIIDMLPKDIVMMFWEYTPRDRYPGFDQLAKAGFQLTSLSTMWDWVSLYPTYALGIRNMDRMALQSKELGALGHFVSSWGDPVRGAAGTNLSELNTFGVAYCGAVSWNPKPIPMGEFSKAFVLQFYGVDSPELAGVLTRLAECQGDRHGYVRGFFQIGPIEAARKLAAVDAKEEAFWRGVKDAADEAVRVLPAIRPPRNGDYLQSVLLGGRMMQFTADLVLLCRSMGRQLGRAEFIAEEYAKAFDALAVRQQELWKDYQKAYLATNRPLNLKHIAPVWDWMHTQLTSAAAQLREGKIK